VSSKTSRRTNSKSLPPRATGHDKSKRWGVTLIGWHGRASVSVSTQSSTGGRWKKRKWYRHPATFAALVVVLVALAVPVSFALASGGSAVTVPLLHNTANCGLGSSNSAIGTVSLSRDKAGNLTVKVDIRGAEPSTPTGCGCTTPARIAAIPSGAPSATPRSAPAAPQRSPGVPGHEGVQRLLGLRGGLHQRSRRRIYGRSPLD
jgi:hypothetical protein